MLSQPRWDNGLVVGKFRPFHRGHQHLIGTAASNVVELTVMVVSSKDDDIDAHKRARWITRTFPKVNVIVIPGIPTDDSDPQSHWIWAEYVRRILGYAPDVVFTSEDYGEGWAKELGCDHMSVDHNREKFQVSGSAIRKHPSRYLHMLNSVVRADYVPRIVILGAESSGTTTLARDLAAYYANNHFYPVPEYGRMMQEHAVARGEKIPEDGWTDSMFWLISRGQDAMEDRYAEEAQRVLLCDTDSLATAAWYVRYNGYGDAYDGLLRAGIEKSKQHALYILTDCHDVPFVNDGTRDNDGGRKRDWMQNQLLYYLEFEIDTPSLVVTGDRQDRLDKAIRHIDAVLDVSVSV